MVSMANLVFVSLTNSHLLPARSLDSCSGTGIRKRTTALPSRALLPSFPGLPDNRDLQSAPAPSWPAVRIWPNAVISVLFCGIREDAPAIHEHASAPARLIALPVFGPASLGLATPGHWFLL